jgi:hypothetical protein
MAIDCAETVATHKPVSKNSHVRLSSLDVRDKDEYVFMSLWVRIERTSFGVWAQNSLLALSTKYELGCTISSTAERKKDGGALQPASDIPLSTTATGNQNLPTPARYCRKTCIPGLLFLFG